MSPILVMVVVVVPLSLAGALAAGFKAATEEIGSHRRRELWSLTVLLSVTGLAFGALAWLLLDLITS